MFPAVGLALLLTIQADPAKPELTPQAEALRARVTDTRWRVLELDDRVLIALDTKTASVTGNSRYVAWELLLLTDPMSWQGEQYDQMKAKIEFDCAHSRTRTSVRSFYLKEKIGMTQRTKEPEWEDVVPETVGESAFAQSCSYFRSHFRSPNR